MPKPETPTSENDDVPELGDAFFARARRGSEALSPAFLEKVRRGRPRADAPKEPVSIRLDADVARHLRAKGKGWQTQVNDALRRLVESGAL